MEVTGTIREVSGLPEDANSLFLSAKDGLDVPLDPKSLPEPLVAGQDVSATLEVPASLVADAITDGLVEPDLTPQVPLDSDDDAGEALLEAASDADVALGVRDLDVLATPEISMGGPAMPHQIDIAFLSVNGRGRFYDEASLKTLTDALSDWYLRETKGEVTAFEYVYANTKAAQSTIQCTSSLAQIANEAAQLFGLPNYNSYMNTNSRRHLIILSPVDERNTTNCSYDYSGVAFLGSNGLASGGATHVITSSASGSRGTLIHEIGHNLQLYHAGAANCLAGVVDAPVGADSSQACKGGTQAENYGDRYNMEGSSASWATTGLNGYQKVKLGIISAEPQLKVVQSAGSYDVTLRDISLTTSSGTEALKIVETMGTQNREYHVEYDSRVGGVSIRRGYNTTDPTLLARGGNQPETYILSPGGSTPSATQRWIVGQTATSHSGKVTIRVDRVTSGQSAQVHVELGQPTPWVRTSITRAAISVTGQPSVSTVVTTEGGNWTASANQTWLSVTGSGATGATLTITAAPAVGSARSGIVTVRSSTAQTQVYVTQDYTPLDLARAWDLTPTTVNPVGVTPEYLRFTAPTTGSYQFESSNRTSNSDPFGELLNSSFARIAYGDDEAGDMNFRFSANLTAGQTYYLGASHYFASQSGSYRVTATVPGVVDAVTLSPTSWQPGAAAANTNVAVTTNQTNWTVTSNQTWLSGSRTNATTLAVSVTANPNTTERVGDLTVAAGTARATFRVTQAGVPETPFISVNPTTWAPGASAASTSVSVTTNQPSWTVTTNQSWLTATALSATSAQVSVTTNTGAARSGTVTFTAGGAQATVQVNQAAAPAAPCSTIATACDWNLSSVLVSPVGTAFHYLKFTAPTSGQYVFESFDRPSTSDPYGVLFNAAGSQLTYNDDGGTDVRNFKITYTLTAGQVYILGARQYSSGQSGQFRVTGTAACSTIAVACDWNLSDVLVSPVGTAFHYLKFTAPVSGQYVFESFDRPSTSDPYGVLFNAAGSQLAYNDDGGRTSLNFRITYALTAGQQYILGARQYSSSQSGQYRVTAERPSLSISPTTWSPDGNAASQVVAVTTNQGIWTVTSNNPWITAIEATVTSALVSVTANTGAARSGTVTFTAGGVIATLQVNQAAAPAAPCSTIATACDWNLSDVLVSPVGTAFHYLKFTAPTSGQYVFESFDRPSTSDPYGVLFNASGSQLTYNDDGGTDLRNFKITYTLTAGQVYILGARQYSSSQSGQYRVTAMAACSTIAAACDWNLSDVLVSPVGTTFHYLKFTAPVSGQYVFESFNRPSTSDPYGVLLNASGSQLTYNDDGGTDVRNFKIVYTLTAGQVYILGARQYSTSQSGEYRVTAVKPAISVSPTTWAPGGGAAYTTVVVTTNQPSWTVQTNQTWLTATASTTTSALVSVAANTGAARSGTVTFTAGGVSAAVTVNQAAAPCSTIATACDWNLSNVLVSPVGTTYHYLKFTAPVTGSYVFESFDRPSTSDPYGVLYNAAGSQLTYNDDGGTDLRNFKITYTLTAGQVYILGARQYSSGQSGQFRVTALVPCSTVATACTWDLRDAWVSPVGTAYTYLKFTAPASGSYTFESFDRPATSDPYAVLLNVIGGQLTYNDDGGADGRNFRITTTLTAGQVYILGVRQYSSTQSGQFRVAARVPVIIT